MKPNQNKKVDGKGLKADDGKIPFELLPYDALTEVAKVLQFGAVKYAARNWERGMSWSRLFGSLMRHMTSFWRGEEKDPETGLPHLAHAACCVLFLLSYQLRNGHAQFDDRPEGEKRTDDDVGNAKAGGSNPRSRARTLE